MTKIITITNLRENTAKTVTTAFVSHYWVLEGKRVLMIDFDESGSLTRFFGSPKPASPFATIMTLCDDETSYLAVENAVKVDEGLWLIGSTSTYFEDAIEKVNTSDSSFRETLSNNGFDLVVIDTDSIPNKLTELSLSVSDHLLIPTTKDFVAFKKVLRTIEYAENVGFHVGEDTVSVLLTMTRGSIRETEDLENFSRQNLVLRTEIPAQIIRLLEAGITAFEYPRLSAKSRYRDAGYYINKKIYPKR